LGRPHTFGGIEAFVFCAVVNVIKEVGYIVAEQVDFGPAGREKKSEYQGGGTEADTD
jgi:hypothetical protein